MKKFRFMFSDGTGAERLLKKADDIRVGDIFYSQNVSKDEDWGETLKRENLCLIKITSPRNSDGKYSIDFIRVKNGKLKVKKYKTNANKLFNFIKTGKAK